MSDPTRDMDSAKGYFNLAENRFQSRVNSAGGNNFEYEIAMGLLNLNTALNLSSGAIFERIQRLHAKIDRIETRLGPGR